jgi:hypothetical protein
MSATEYRYALEIFREDGTPIGQVPVSVDFEAARECALFAGMRRNSLAIDEITGNSSILPLWHPDDGRPYLDGFRVAFDGEAGETADDFTGGFATDYFRPAARKASVGLVAEGRLKEGEHFRFRTLAFPAPVGGDSAAATSREARDVSPPLDLRETRLADLMEGALTSGTVDAEDFPVFLPSRVLEEVRELSRGAGAHETGGFLVGHLHRDGSLPEIFAEITAQIPARHVISDTSRLTFTQATWTEAQGMLDLRQRGEQWLGWWHRHPCREWCKNCSIESQRVCHLANDFFSEHDRQVHQAVFSRAFNVALVLNDVAFSDATYSLFGWRRGGMEPRGFHVLAGRSVPAS